MPPWQMSGTKRKKEVFILLMTDTFSEIGKVCLDMLLKSAPNKALLSDKFSAALQIYRRARRYELMRDELIKSAP
jgi:hypothetical protein